MATRSLALISRGPRSSFCLRCGVSRSRPQRPLSSTPSSSSLPRAPKRTDAHVHPSRSQIHEAAPRGPQAAGPAPSHSLKGTSAAHAGKPNPAVAALGIPDLYNDDDLLAHMPKYTHEGQWDNPWPTWKAKTLMDIAKFLARGFKNKLPSKAVLDRYYPVHSPDYDAIYTPDKNLIQATWVGHSTFLVQTDGLNFLTDPVWTEYASPIPFGPKRFRPPGIPVEKLPKIDFVLLSHNHYDHLDLAMVQHIGNAAKWSALLFKYIPFGMKEWFYGENVTNVVELGWWEHAIHGNNAAAVFLLPAQHWSKRTMWDERHTLWGSFALLTPRHRIYFAGDTGYCSVFPEIGKRFGPFDLSLLPIGAYEPKAFMGPAHVDPGGAVDIHKDIQSKKSIGMHFGTFRLTDELTHEPPRLLLEELQEREVSPSDFFVVKHGETVKLLKEGNNVTVL